MKLNVAQKSIKIRVDTHELFVPESKLIPTNYGAIIISEKYYVITVQNEWNDNSFIRNGKS